MCMRTSARSDKSVLSNWWRSVDRPTFFALTILVICGIVLVTAASPAVAERYGLPPFYFVHKQIIFLAPTLLILFGMSMMEEQALWRTALITLGVTLALMGAAILFGP